MSMMMKSRKWSKERRAAYNLKKKRFNDLLAPVEVNKIRPYQEQVDIEKHAEFNYRRGLIAALDCIIRELR